MGADEYKREKYLPVLNTDIVKGDIRKKLSALDKELKNFSKTETSKLEIKLIDYITHISKVNFQMIGSLNGDVSETNAVNCFVAYKTLKAELDFLLTYIMTNRESEHLTLVYQNYQKFLNTCGNELIKRLGVHPDEIKLEIT